MFGWFRRRVVYEHKKLLVSNYRAASEPELSTRLLFAGDDTALELLNSHRIRTARMLARGVSDSGLAPDVADEALSINKDLMAVYQSSGMGLPAFKRRCEPITGWKYYFQDHPNDWNRLD